MKSLRTLIKIIIVGLCWSLFFFEGIRVILLTNWHFDLIDSRHWEYLWDLWMSGWVVDSSREWAFILLIVSFIPLWLTGWASLSLIKWEDILANLRSKIIKLINNIFPQNKKAKAEPLPAPTRPTIKKKKSYKEIRPRSLSTPLSAQAESISQPTPIATSNIQPSIKPMMPSNITTSPSPTSNSILNHSLFNFEDDEDNDFDLNFDDLDKIENKPQKETPNQDSAPTTKTENKKSENNKDNKERKDNKENKKPAPKKDNKDNKDNKENNKDKETNRKNNKQSEKASAPKNVGNSSLEIIKQKGYQPIISATIKNNFVDFIGVADKQICICMVDKEAGDWLADEERFNDEEPLWFSESSHRISPVRCADIVQNYLSTKLKENDLDYKISTYVIIQYGNIINAEDMFETWQSMNINVTRIDRGTPREIKLFAKTLEDADKSIDNDRFEKIKKIIRNLA